MKNQAVVNLVNKIVAVSVCTVISTVASAMASQFIVPKIEQVREEGIKARKNPIGFRAD